jgi:hypothetical protein
VFTGVSGSGKSSLVFGTVAAESQRLINETDSAFVQGFMPTLARPDVDSLDGLTTAIILDQERMGANARSTVGTATDANAMLRDHRRCLVLRVARFEATTGVGLAPVSPTKPLVGQKPGEPGLARFSASSALPRSLARYGLDACYASAPAPIAIVPSERTGEMRPKTLPSGSSR